MTTRRSATALASTNVQNIPAILAARQPTTEASRCAVVFASMAAVEVRPALQRATFRVAALSLWGLGGVVMASNYVGSGLQVNYGIEWIITGAAVAALLCTGLVASVPLLLQGWNGYYARALLVLLASMVVCAFVPSMVAAALRKENRLVERQRDELEQSYLATIAALAAALDAKDRHTEAHSRETAALARAVGRRLGLKDDDLRFLEYSALLHDIGKIGVPGYILNKPGPIAAPGRGTGSSKKSTRSRAGSSTPASPRRYCRWSNPARLPSAAPPRAPCTKITNRPSSTSGRSTSTPSSNWVPGSPPW